MSGTPHLRHGDAGRRPPLTPQSAPAPQGGRERVATPHPVAPSPAGTRLASAGKPAAAKAVPPPDPKAFIHRFDSGYVQRAQRLVQRASAPVARLNLGAGPQSVPRHHRDAIDLAGLLRVYEASVPPECLKDPERTLGALEELVTARVTPEELTELLARGRMRDAWRSVASAELTFALSFGAAGGTGLSLAEQPLVDGAPHGAEAAGLVQGLNAGTAFMLTGGIIAVGGEVAQAIVREGKMGPRYNAAITYDETGRRVPFAQSAAGQQVQSRSAAPFGLLYAADHVAREWLPVPPAVRLAAGAGAAAVSALYKLHAATRSVAQLDPTWLDGSTHAKREAMQAAIQDLRQGAWEATRGYCAHHVAPGVAAAAGEVISAKAAVRVVGRLAAATVARAGTALMAATGTATNLYARLGSEAWLGATWGTASTWPQRLLEGAARDHAQESAPVAATPVAVKAVVPRSFLPEPAR